jgi:hypothetical protein
LRDPGASSWPRRTRAETLDAIVVAAAAIVGGAVLTDDLSDLRPLGAAAGVRIVPLRQA